MTINYDLLLQKEMTEDFYFLTGFCVPIKKEDVKYYDLEMGSVGFAYAFFEPPQEGDDRAFFDTIIKLRNRTIRYMAPSQLNECEKNIQALAETFGFKYKGPLLSAEDRHYFFINQFRAKGNPEDISCRDFITHFTVPLTWQAYMLPGEQRFLKNLILLRDKFLKSMTLKQQYNCDKNITKLTNSLGLTTNFKISKQDKEYLWINSFSSSDPESESFGFFIEYFCSPLDDAIIHYIAKKNVHEKLVAYRNLYTRKLTTDQLKKCDENLQKIAEKIGESYTPQVLSSEESESIQTNDRLAALAKLASSPKKQKSKLYNLTQDRSHFVRTIYRTVIDLPEEDRAPVCRILLSKFGCTEKEAQDMIAYIKAYNEIDLSALLKEKIPKFDQLTEAQQRETNLYLASVIGGSYTKALFAQLKKAEKTSPF